MNDKATADRNRELLSALMDGEASEHEVRQALRAVGDDPALAATWRRYHLAQAALRGDRQVFAGADLRAAIAGKLNEEPVPAAAAPRAWLKPLASVAIAASITMVTVFSWQAFRDARTPTAGAETVAAVAPVVEQRVALGPMVMVREDGEELVMPVAASAGNTESPTAAQDRLNAYLTRHAQAAGAANARGLAPYARVVSLEAEQAP
jgi:sigma-E factor negative regulatory protein RseA